MTFYSTGIVFNWRSDTLLDTDNGFAKRVRFVFNEIDRSRFTRVRHLIDGKCLTSRPTVPGSLVFLSPTYFAYNRPFPFPGIPFYRPTRLMSTRETRRASFRDIGRKLLVQSQHVAYETATRDFNPVRTVGIFPLLFGWDGNISTSRNRL